MYERIQSMPLMKMIGKLCHQDDVAIVVRCAADDDAALDEGAQFPWHGQLVLHTTVVPAFSASQGVAYVIPFAPQETTCGQSSEKVRPSVPSQGHSLEHATVVPPFSASHRDVYVMLLAPQEIPCGQVDGSFAHGQTLLHSAVVPAFSASQGDGYVTPSNPHTITWAQDWSSSSPMLFFVATRCIARHSCTSLFGIARRCVSDCIGSTG